MKNFAIILFFVLFKAFTYGQANEKKYPFPKCNQIVVTTSLSDEELYQKIGKTLIEKGFFIDNVNKDFQTITTTSYITPKASFSYFLNIRIENQQVFISGLYAYNRSIGNAHFRIDYSLGSSKDYRSIFTKMIDFATALEGNTTVYRQVVLD
ncbi:hypothetical protein [Flectobacillus major]|jgi:hypothetical protein|uniref:hypothetical protein n=1 Tax=Flectobacillus major TaxID=103 RepID=UPI00041C1B9C|nr:hypothetical protein [Flectobacillus major]